MSETTALYEVYLRRLDELNQLSREIELVIPNWVRQDGGTPRILTDEQRSALLAHQEAWDHLARARGEWFESVRNDQMPEN